MPGTFGTGPNQPGVKATSTLSSGVDGASQRGDGVLGKANARGGSVCTAIMGRCGRGTQLL
jgi:hypothetical protein